MKEDYRNTRYCPKLKDVVVKKGYLDNKIKKEHPRAKIIYNQVRENKGDYKREFMNIYNYKCSYCGNSISNLDYNLFEVDHYICESSFSSMELAGKLENLVLACYDCNRNKKGLVIKSKYKELLNPDLENIKEVFFRDENYYINITDRYIKDDFINLFYKQLKLGYQTRRLDFLLMNIRGLCNEISGHAESEKIKEILIKLEEKRNLTSCK
ncbi:HNH endonuclease [Clostridium perfringens]|uniref:HNH endonuclease n=1 Tax=Clostridium perfringens TaxID=1502 RepID=UPI00285E92C2|nr:HNH endonuclease [Clostridium perfringens]MDM0633363.1 HNH endonuclease [Clostridium perfringens]MDM0670562.1 HNH endonuclease [Clostridium perfringens]MDM0719157.1 HNH endonuclease [Clostridium perfringens]